MDQSDFSDVLILSPHLDDAVLSCGGLIWQRARAGHDSRIVTVFAGTPDADAASLPFAVYQHRMWGNPPHPMRLRHAEDRAAGARIGVTDIVHLPLLDAVYRCTNDGHPYYTSDTELFGDVHPDDRSLIERMIQALAPHLRSDTTVLAPLGVGHHIDHQLVRDAADRLLDAGYTVIFYEELPYVEVSGALDDTDCTASLHVSPVSLDESAMAAKLDALSYYQTQIPVLYGSCRRMRERVRAYAARVAPAGTRYVERCWLPDHTT